MPLLQKPDVHSVDMTFALSFFISLMRVSLTPPLKNELFIFIHNQVKSFVFAVYIKVCDESGVAILK